MVGNLRVGTGLKFKFPATAAVKNPSQRVPVIVFPIISSTASLISKTATDADASVRIRRMSIGNETEQRRLITFDATSF